MEIIIVPQSAKRSPDIMINRITDVDFSKPIGRLSCGDVSLH
jgi:hypothetical protein